METEKNTQGTQEQQKGNTEKYQQKEHDGEHDNQYADDQGEDENGEKPSADEQG